MEGTKLALSRPNVAAVILIRFIEKSPLFLVRSLMETLRSSPAFQALRLLYGSFANFHIKRKAAFRPPWVNRPAAGMDRATSWQELARTSAACRNECTWC